MSCLSLLILEDKSRYRSSTIPASLYHLSVARDEQNQKVVSGLNEDNEWATKMKVSSFFSSFLVLEIKFRLVEEKHDIVQTFCLRFQ